MLEKIPIPDPTNVGQPIEPHKMTMSLPKDLYIHNREDPKIGWWDAEDKKWKYGPDHFEEVELDAYNNLSFKVGRFAPFALL